VSLEKSPPSGSRCEKIEASLGVEEKIFAGVLGSAPAKKRVTAQGRLVARKALDSWEKGSTHKSVGRE